MKTSNSTQKPTEFDRVLRLMRLGLAAEEQRVGALHTPMREIVEQLEADRLLVMGWICAAEMIEQDKAKLAQSKPIVGYSNFR